MSKLDVKGHTWLLRNKCLFLRKFRGGAVGIKKKRACNDL